MEARELNKESREWLDHFLLQKAPFKEYYVMKFYKFLSLFQHYLTLISRDMTFI